MAVAARLQIILWLFLCQYLTFVSAYPTTAPAHQLVPRGRPHVIIKNSTCGIEVLDPITRTLIAQGPATDGSGSNFSPPALIWVGFCFGVGVPLALAGIRGWRLTTGAGVGLAGAVCSWAAFINSVDSTGVPDILLTVIVLVFFFLGFILGVFNFARLGGLALLAITGGLAFGMRIVLLRDGLLLNGDSLFALNWVLIAVFGGVSGLALIWLQRAVIVLSCSSVGSFLAFLGVDLVLNKQSGMSRGLRFLFDRNTSHLADILTNGYSPSLTTRILIVASLALTPILAYAQHRIFKQPFSRKPPPSDAEFGVTISSPIIERQRATFLSGLWDTKEKSRFSL